MDTVTHLSTNRARRKVTSLIETNALPLRQTADQMYEDIRQVSKAYLDNDSWPIE